MTATAPTAELLRLRTLPLEVREALLAELLKEVSDGETGPIALMTAAGEDMGYYLPPHPKEPRTPPAMTAEEAALRDAALANLDKSVNAKDFFAQLNREDAASHPRT